MVSFVTVGNGLAGSLAPLTVPTVDARQRPGRKPLLAKIFWPASLCDEVRKSFAACGAVFGDRGRVLDQERSRSGTM